MTDSKYIDVLYTAKKKPFTKYPKKLVKELVKRFELNVNSSILELGCGRGEFLSEFISIGMRGFGVDLSNYAKDFCNNAEIKVSDITKDKLPYPDNYFDIIYSKSFIEHFYYPDEVFKEAHRVLKPSGIFINLTPEWKYIYTSFYEDFTHRTPFTKKSLEDIHLITGFKDVKVQSFKQLPILWSDNFFIKNLFKFFSELTRIMVPDFFRLKFKWIKFSKEIMLLSFGRK
jgi:SAM-dependent methyltransferase|tara:strand:- start:592 stop:1278 length:687 start_codon:yes stop_codon:yes gene_type:complete